MLPRLSKAAQWRRFAKSLHESGFVWCYFQSFGLFCGNLLVNPVTLCISMVCIPQRHCSKAIKKKLNIKMHTSIRVLTEALLSWMPRFLANSFLALNYVFSVQMWYICLNLLIWAKKVHFIYSKLNLRQKNCLLEI